MDKESKYKIIKTNLIEEYITKNNLSKIEFCKRCNISYSVLKKILKNKKNFRINSLFKIAKEIDIDAFELCI